MHLGQDDVAAADRHQRQPAEQDREVQIRLHAGRRLRLLRLLGPRPQQAQRREDGEHLEQRPPQDAVEDERPEEQPYRRKAGQTLLPGLDRHRQSQCDGGGRRPVQDALHRGHLLEPEVRVARDEDQEHRHQAEAEQRGPGAGDPAHLRAREDGHVDLVGAGQDPAHRHGAEELLVAHPALLDHQHLARPRGQPAAERCEGNVVERQRKLKQRRPWRLGDVGRLRVFDALTHA